MSESKPCIFCEIARGTIPSQPVYQDDRVIAFPDMHPQAPVHVLIIPRAHYAHIGALADGLSDSEAASDAAALLAAVPRVAEALNITESGYRVLTNCGEGAGQSVHHVHLHLLSGPTLKERLL